MSKRVLLVEVRRDVVRHLEELLLGAAAAVDVAEDFVTARKRLFSTPAPELLVTSLHLGAYNGLHLVHLARLMEYPHRAIVFSDELDPYVVRETRALGAFYESTSRIPLTIRTYLASQLPDRDRRVATIFDRRQVFRGGRRSGDVPVPTPARPAPGTPLAFQRAKR